MKTIKASEFKAKCLQLMSEIAETGDVMVITKKGQPVAQLAPSSYGQPPLSEDIVVPMGELWDAECSPS